jgi:hypothetical protein
VGGHQYLPGSVFDFLGQVGGNPGNSSGNTSNNSLIKDKLSSSKLYSSTAYVTWMIHAFHPLCILHIACMDDICLTVICVFPL